MTTEVSEDGGGGKSLEQDLKEKVGMGAQAVGSFLGSAWSKASEGAAFFSFATGPDDEEDEPLDPSKLPTEPPKAEDGEEAEEEETEDPLSSFISAAMCKVGFSSAQSQGSKEEEIKSSESSYSLVDSAYSVFEKAKKTLEDTIYSVDLPFLDADEGTRKHVEDTRIRNIYRGMYPWLGYEKEAELKGKVLELSSDKRNFLFDPPEGVSFDFDYAQATGVAEGLLSQDENLQVMRYRIVPKMKSEEAFWRNYFYRVNLIQQCYELKSVEEYVNAADSNDGQRRAGADSSSPLEELLPNGGGDDEFVSESFLASSKDLDEAAVDAKKLSSSSSREEDEIEAELENELQEYEVVKEGGRDEEEWENQLEEMLEST